MNKQELKDELKKSMLAKDELKTSVLRMLLSSLSYLEIQKGKDYEANSEDVLSIIQKEAKQRNDSIEQFKSAGRDELVKKEEQELELLKKYLPEQMNNEELEELVTKAISQTNASSMQDMGKVMGALMPMVKGKANGSVISKIVRERLS
ncbi:MAG TPA: GatB/YqeY domain-containing protein [Patescibacteria group bacterium]|nr:GatB/YqeY domain-containing protein [Patescibacteria group bacterium]